MGGGVGGTLPSTDQLEPLTPSPQPRAQVGEEVKVDVLRRGREKLTLSVKLAERQPEPSE